MPDVLTWIVLPLRAVGAMPLTAYTAQLVVWAIAATAVLGDPGDLGGFRDLSAASGRCDLITAGRSRARAWALLIGRGSARMGRRPRFTTARCGVDRLIG